MRQGRLEEARNHCEQAYNTRIELFGHDHMEVADSLLVLGHISLNLADIFEASTFFYKALETLLKLFGEVHHLVADTYATLGRVEGMVENHSKARLYYEKVVDIRIKVFGDQHDNVEAALNSLGGSCFSQEDFEKARECFDKVLAMQMVRYGGPNHHRVQQTLAILETIATRQNRFEDAKYFSSKLLNQKPNNQYVSDLLKSNEEWRAMKMIVLGNGQIGKTTFVRFLHRHLDPTLVSLSVLPIYTISNKLILGKPRLCLHCWN